MAEPRGKVSIKNKIGHFLVVLNLIMKARLSAKIFIGKLVLLACELKLIS